MSDGDAFLRGAVEILPLDTVEPNGWNPNVVPPHIMESIREGFRTDGWLVSQALLVWATDEHGVAVNRIIDGEHRWEAARAVGLTEGPMVLLRGLPVHEAKALTVKLNQKRGAWDLAGLGALLRGLEEAAVPVEAASMGFTVAELDAIVAGAPLPQLPPPGGGDGEGGGAPPPENTSTPGSLSARFGVPPFSVLDARQGYWQDRKRAWLAHGIRSELGRGGALAYDLRRWERGAKSGPRQTPSLKGGLTYGLTMSPYSGGGVAGAAEAGTSIFDPVLCELAYRWFSPPGGTVLDPFAGGSVRGAVAYALGRAYTGVDLRAEQAEANRAQWVELEPALRPPAPVGVVLADVHDPRALTPVVAVGDQWMKRDDLFTVAGVRGGKARSCWGLAQGARGLVTAGSRSSPQANIVAHVAHALGIPARVHTPEGEAGDEVAAAEAVGAERVGHRAGYNNVIIARAHEDAAALGWMEIPFGMECAAAVDATAAQVANIPPEVGRLVVPVGSGMSLAGILWGLHRAARRLPVLGVVVGADPAARLDKWAPPDWRDMVTLVPSNRPYAAHADPHYRGVTLDPVYEAKCVPHLQAGDCLWCVGIRQTAEPAAVRPPPPAPVWVTGDSMEIAKLVTPPEGGFDMLFSCPPYADLEVYSDDPLDLSTMDFGTFLAAYRAIIQRAGAMLAPDRFAVWVVGDVRAPDGTYRNFVGLTIQAFIDAGFRLHNEAVLLTSLGSLPIRAGRSFTATRKLGKGHQNVLVFVKGRVDAAVAACGEVEGWAPLVEGEEPEGEEPEAP